MPKRIRDPLYGFIEIPDEYRHIVDHKILQRLRWVNQLPLEQLVYPAAQHSRFEHSLGTMHLARKAASHLILNSTKKFSALAKLSPYFSDLKKDNRSSLFIKCAGLVGLLHDIGHAPFSHTMEDACQYSDDIAFKYNHEIVGCLLVKFILEDTKSLGIHETTIISRVLNKKITNESLSPIEVLLRNLVDGPFDVDKGDYIRRDSYHCGVVYGVYDIDRLWDNIVISDTNMIGIDEKGALEVWSLRIARYKMTKNVYKHHVRNITDALLIEVISSGLSTTKNDPQQRQKIIPFESEGDLGVDENRTQFCLWNDNTILKALSDLKDAKIKSKIESFMARSLFKRFFSINLTKQFPEAKNSLVTLHNKIQETKQLYSEKNIEFNYIIDKEILPPVFEDEVQKDIRVSTDRKHLPLADYIGFRVKDDDRDKSYVRNQYLRIFAKDSDRGNLEEMRESICRSLSEFSVEGSITKLPFGE